MHVCLVRKHGWKKTDLSYFTLSRPIKRRQTSWQRETERKDEEAEKEVFYARIDVLTAMNMKIALFRAADILKTNTKPFSETLLSFYMTTQSLREKVLGWLYLHVVSIKILEISTGNSDNFHLFLDRSTMKLKTPWFFETSIIQLPFDKV
jgi:hypothetical protein